MFKLLTTNIIGPAQKDRSEIINFSQELLHTHIFLDF